MVSENDITVGVELEFLVCKLAQAAPELMEFKLVAQALDPVAKSMKTSVIDSGSKRDLLRIDIQDLHRAFHVHYDGSIEPDSQSERGVEVSTPILTYEDFRPAISQMCHALNTGLTLRVNLTTGLHVHVGIGRDYTLKELKSISKSIIIFEQKMDSYHPPDRVRTELSDPFVIQPNRQNKVLKHFSDLQCIEAIDAATTVHELLLKINCSKHPEVFPCPARHYKYNLIPAVSFGTVEFRQAAATTNDALIIDWIERTTRFILSAISTSDSDFRTWAINGVSNPQVYQRFGVPE